MEILNSSGKIPSTLYPYVKGWYEFSYNDSTITYDLSGNNNTGTLSGATWTANDTGGYMQFDGINDGVSITTNQSLNVTSTNMFSISCWVKSETNCASGARIICERYIASPGYFSYGLMGITNNYRVYAIGATRTIGAYYGPISVGTWVHLVGTMNYATGESKLYLNGVLVKTQTYAGGTGANGTPTATVWLGKRYDNSRYWKGGVDALQIYSNYLLSSNECYRLSGRAQ